ncbi:MAG TPA: bifunctional phosphoribosyl-AMP cyclohydrolase/phosphoribosyl-ATP diphosphatase HisIE [Holophagaceae bacterium]|nr:bifunctional phosphoribosyl-AMP cyclohydrolase/phosphoribosyl-ATP diphosphatase HisIE [Holophagaceae bacterium]
MLNPDDLTFDPQGLLPAVVQDAFGRVRMLGWMDREAIRATLDGGFVTFWSRSRKRLWTKGETSGHRLRLLSLRADCDGDTLLVTAEPEGPTCHTGSRTCFGEDGEGLPWLGDLEDLLRSRKASASLEGSYTEKLFARGVDRIAKKVVEEAGEVAIAAKNDDRDEFLGEAADLLFHLEALLVQRGASLAEVAEALRGRHLARKGRP